MAHKYASNLDMVVIAQITQTIGYSCTLSAPLELLQDIMQKFMQEFARDLHGHMEHANRTKPSLKDARLSVKNLNINVQELLDYIGNVEPVGFTRDVPHFPLKKSVNMNFLKPGSAETLTRPVYIFEYLPPMEDPEPQDIQIEHQKGLSQKREFDAIISAEKLGNSQIDNLSSNVVINFPSNSYDLDIGRSVREMNSVVMTTGGFISPAIEGKLPEACVPDIIEKYKGLDAPPPLSILLNPSEHSPKLATLEKEAAINERKVFSQQHSETKAFNRNAAPLTIDNEEASLLLASNNPPMSTTLTGTFKKNKKHKQDLVGGLGQKDKSKNFLSKPQEKSQRKASKMHQKLSKNQNNFSNNQILNLKKSKKRVNQGNSSSDQNKINLEKMLKKQAKHKQKGLQHELDGKIQLQNNQTMSGFTLDESPNSSPAGIDSEIPVAIKHLESNSQSSIFPVQLGVIQKSQVPLPPKKNSSEPERSKLDIFKKFSKPRTPRQDGGATLMPADIGLRVFGSTMSASPLINLPSGTTITPTTSLNLNLENISVPNININHYGALDPTPPSSKTAVDTSVLDSAKPKKRGRKPGGKNVVKPINLTSHSLIESAKREKSNRVISLPLASSSIVTPQHSLNTPLLTEPLNLRNTVQPSSEYLPHLQAKEKKERKKHKSENLKEFSNKVYSAEKTSSTLTTSVHATERENGVPFSDPFVTVSNTLSHTSIYPGNQSGMVPLLPLLHFPPRPGLIPSGPGLFPAVTGLVGFGNTGNQVGIAPFINFSGPEGSVADTVRCRPIKDSADTDEDQFMRRSSTQKDLQVERGYCNVAPLVPDAIKLAQCNTVTCGNIEMESSFLKAPHKIKSKLSAQASGNLGDPIEVSDDSDESIQNRQTKSPLSLSSHARSSLVQPQEQSFAPTTSICEDKPHSDLRNIFPSSSNESVKKCKKPLKISFPDVKNLIHTVAPPSSFSQFNLPNFKGGDKFSLAGGADLIPLSRIDCGSAYSSQKVPFSSLTRGATSAINPTLHQENISEEQPFLPSFSNYEDITITPTGTLSLDLKIHKHHKKLKKLKDGKIKKKKDKKDKSKKKDWNGIKSYKTDRKTKSLDKKQKKEKKKDKEKQILIHIPGEVEDFPRPPSINNVDLGFTQNVLLSTPELKSSPTPIKPQLTATCEMSPKSQHSPSQIPKLTLKIGKSTPLPSSDKEKDTLDAGKVKPPTLVPEERKERERNNSPELARFSPLVTGPPKNKQSDAHFLGVSSTGPLSSNCSVTTTPIISEPSPIVLRATQMPISQTSSNSVDWPSNSNAASSTLSASSVLLPQQLMLTPNTIINNFSSIMGNSAGPAQKNGSFSSPPNISEENTHFAESSRPSSYVDAEGNRIWICPACGKVDDGSAMIGCDGCDAWYHWICVGITFAPKDNDDWFCRVCVTKKRVHGAEKKKRRNKKK